jgi:hypothetical protein
VGNDAISKESVAGSLAGAVVELIRENDVPRVIFFLE